MSQIRFFIFIFFFLISCLENYELCDNLENNFGKCKVNEDRIDFNKKFDIKNQLQEIGYELYFHKKITYGVIIKTFQNNWEDWKCFFSIQDSEKKFKKVSIPMEGRRIANSFIPFLWCFDYVGNLLLEFYKENQIKTSKITQINQNFIIEILIYDKEKLKKTLQREMILKNLY